MLQLLKNDEIYPYFWRCRARNKAEDVFSYLDLDALKQSPPSDDHALESLLYGASERPHYSGWTLTRLRRTLEKSGYAEPKRRELRSFVATVAATSSPWPRSSQSESAAWRREQKIWTFRKDLRSTAGGWKARLLSLTKSRPPTDSLNLGAGAENYPGYTKVDIAGAQDIYDNIVTLTKIRDGSVSRIYCNHVLEHIPPALLEPMLHRWREVLKPGGVVMARTPDAKQALLHLNERWQETTESKLSELGLPNFLEREPARDGVLDDDSCIQTIYGWSNSTPHTWDMPNQHKSLWTPQLARERFERAGFVVETAENLGTLNTVVIARKPK